MVVMVTGPSFQDINWGTYIGKSNLISLPSYAIMTVHVSVFAALNAFIIPIVYLFFPETAGRSLEGETCTNKYGGY